MKNFSRYADKNKYGGYTWMFKFDESIFHVFIHSTPNNYFIVELKEWGVLWYKKTHFTFVSKVGLLHTVQEAYHKTISLFRANPKLRKNKLDERLAYHDMIDAVKSFENSKDNLTASFWYNENDEEWEEMSR